MMEQQLFTATTDIPPVQTSLPYSQETEQAIIGAILLNPGLLDEINLVPDDFYITRNRIVWEALKSLNKKGGGIDYITLLDELENQGHLEEIGGSAYVAGLINNSGLLPDIKYYAGIIKTHAKRRAMLTAASDIAKVAYNEDPANLDGRIGDIVARLLRTSTPEKGLVPINEALNKLSADIDERCKDPREIWGIPTGFIDLDHYLGGLQKGEVFYLGGEPAAGKTKLAIQIGLNAASEKYGNHRVAIYSLEMRDIAIARRMVSAIKPISTRAMKSGRMGADDWTNYYAAIQELSSYYLYLCDASQITTNELRADIANRKNHGRIDLVIVDYLLLMSGYEKIDNETERSTRLSRDIKSIAKDLNVAIIAVNSVTKEGMDSGLALKKNLRGSGQLIHDADLIAILVIKNGQEKVDMKTVNLIFTKVRDVEMGVQTIELLADNTRPIFHSLMPTR